MVKVNEKQAQINWDNYRQGIRKGTPVNLSESSEVRTARIKRLEADKQQWKEYYFPKFFKYPTPKFHLKASDRIHQNFAKKKHYYVVRSWARGLAKSTTSMLDVLYLVLTGKLKNIILTSSTNDAADAFLEKYRSQLDTNARIIQDYGKQELPGSWAIGDFTTRGGAKFLALGARQSPRGNGNEEIRPDCIIADDFDTDEECRNPDILNQKWKWFEEALFFTVDLSEPYLILWNGNIIAEDCCVVRAAKMADHAEIINIREDGVSVWPEKNKEADIDYAETKTSYESYQKELYNNPISQGQTFEEMIWGKCPKLKELDHLLIYADPSPSDKDMPTQKSKATGSCKAVILIGYAKQKFYAYKAFLNVTSNRKFVDWLFACHEIVGTLNCPVYIENNTLQDPFYQQVLKPLIFAQNTALGRFLPVLPDERKKPGKFVRIEGTLEPLNRLGQLILNEEEKSNPHMLRLEAQFKGVKPNSKTMDGPDCFEGGVHILKQKVAIVSAGGFEMIARTKNAKRF